MIRITPHPGWVEDLLAFIAPYQQKIVNHRFFDEICDNVLRQNQFQAALVNFYPLIESFPQYMALSLIKVPPGSHKWGKRIRHWLITNIDQERLHVEWWKDFAGGGGVPDRAFAETIYPIAAVDAVNNYLWRICTHGSLAESICAANFAIEGPTGEWAKRICGPLRQYRYFQASEETLRWIAVHASYDDKHPYEALEIIKASVITNEEREKVRQAAKRALEYYVMALDACYASK